tara:strand:- start:17664 stop:18011 length:348 start_codon:yes stop_codon:yes gene_type:complete
MSSTLQALSERSHYRAASIALLAAAYGWVLLVRLSGYPDWIGAIVGLPLYTFLIVITYRRLRDAALPGGWIILMILVFNFGPEWNGFHLGLLINLLPVALAWISPSNSGSSAQTA